MNKLLVEAAANYITKHFSGDRLDEELSSKQKAKIAAMPDTSKAATNHHDKIFGEGNDTIEIPYSREHDEPITSDNFQRTIRTKTNRGAAHHEAVFDHLHKNGYEVTNYVNGLARKKTNDPNVVNREEKIGKILSRTGADDIPTGVMSKTAYKYTKDASGTNVPERDSMGNKVVAKPSRQLSISESFANDPIRAAKKDVKLIVTRSKEGVGGCSTGKGWTSCMNVDSGLHRHSVPKDIKHGTLAAYLVRNGDEKSLDNPVGRVLIKPFHATLSTHTVYRPEDAVYGAMPASAHTAIKNWAESVYPHKKDEIYTKNHNLYDDDGVSTFTTFDETNKQGEHAEKFLKTIHNNLDNLVDRHFEKGNGNDDELDYKVDRYMSHVPDHYKDFAHLHAVLSTPDTDGPDSSNVLRHWAMRGDHTPDTSNLTDDGIKHLLDTAQSSARYRPAQFAGNETLEPAVDAHGEVIREALYRNNQENKDQAISHLVNHGADNQWYEQLNDNGGVSELHKHTTNPYLLAKIHEHSVNETLPSIMKHPHEMYQSDQQPYYETMGKYGDKGLLQDIMHPDHYSGIHEWARMAMHDAIKQRPDAAEIHAHIDQHVNNPEAIEDSKKSR